MKQLARFFGTVSGKQSDILIPTIDRLLKRARRSRFELGLVAVDVGPGSFTGVRVGVSTARAIAQALEIPVIGVSALEIAAVEMFEKDRSAEKILVWRPAVAGEVYWGVYLPSPLVGEGRVGVTRSGHFIRKIDRSAGPHPSRLRRADLPHEGGGIRPQWTPIEILEREAARLSSVKGARIIGIETRDVRPSFPARVKAMTVPAPRPEVLARIAIERFRASADPGVFSVDAVVPMYLQPSWAERSKAAAPRRRSRR